MSVTATDRYRIANDTVPATGTCEETVLLPAVFIAELLPLLAEDQLTVGVDHIDADTWTTITCGTLTARARSHTDTYPRIAHLLPAGGAGTVHVPADQLRKATARAAALTTALGDTGTPLQIVVRPRGQHGAVVPVTNQGIGTAPAPPVRVDVSVLPHRIGSNPINRHQTRICSGRRCSSRV